MSTTEIAVYDRVDNPLEFAERMGKAMAQSGIFGCRNEQQGIVLAMACLAEKKNPIELARTYHIIDGKLSMRADAMLAEFRLRGGKHKWLETGDDGQQASGQFVYDGQEQVVSFSLADAQRMKLVRSGSTWEKDPGAMLRARVVSKAIRMIAPEIVAGCYAPEEIEHGNDRVIDTQRVEPDDAKELMRQLAAKAERSISLHRDSAAVPKSLASEEAGREAQLSTASGGGEDAAPPPVSPPAAQAASQGDKDQAAVDRITKLANTVARIQATGPRAFGDAWPDAKAAALKNRGVGRLDSLTQEQADDLLSKLLERELGLKKN